MLEEKELQTYIRDTFTNSIIEQAQTQWGQRDFKTFNVTIDLLYTLKNNPKIAGIIIGKYPYFIQWLEKTIQQLILQKKIPQPAYGIKVAVYFENCTIPRHNVKSLEFVTAALSQKDGILVYLKDAQIVQIKGHQLYLQSWDQIWEFTCECQFDGKDKNRIIKKRVTQSLLDILTKGSTHNLKQYFKPQDPIECPQCKMNLRFITRNGLSYDHCQQIQVMVETRSSQFENQVQFFNPGNLKILVDRQNAVKFKKGEIVNLCCYFKSSVNLVKSFTGNSRTSVQISNLVYLVSSYPYHHYLSPSNNIFFNKLRKITLEQKPIQKINNINDIIYNYKNLTETINQIRYPYLLPNSLTALKLVTLSSIFSQQGNQQKINLLIITDEISMMVKMLEIKDLSIKKFPSLYDEKTISNFFNSCNNSIVLISNPEKRQFALINKILRNEVYDNLNFALWIVCEPEQNLKKKFQINLLDIILDLTIEKNLNVCESVYVSTIDTFLESFMVDEGEDDFINTIVKKFNPRLNADYDDLCETQMKSASKNESLKQQRLANDLLRRYFLKARQYKTTKLGTIETLQKIAQSFTQLRYFIENKGFSGTNKRRTDQSNQHLSILDAILAIFIDEETSRNKYSSSNTLFADDVSKIMLNENNCNVSIWDYEIQNDRIQEAKKFIPRDQLLGMVITKIFNLIYEE